MSRRLFLAASVYAAISGCAHVTPPPPTAQAAAEAAALAWLAQVDAGQYEQSWTSSAAIFRGSVTAADWESKVTPVRAPMGKVLTRTLKSADYKTTMPGLADGEFVVLQYDASFEHKSTAVETITPMKEPDGHWAVSGYYIR